MTVGSRRRITRETLFSVIADYAGAPSKDAAERMFERDKAEILALGLDLRAEHDPWDESIVHYRIVRSSDALPSLDLTPAEYTVLLAASRAWDDAAAGGAARRVRAKLLSLGQDVDPDFERRTPRGSIESLPVLAPLLEAVTTGRAVTFRYRPARGGAAERRVEPWVVGVHGGAWYVLGFDLDRGARRLFRASRIESFPRLGGRIAHPAPEGTDLAAAVAGAGGIPDERADAVLDIAPYKALGLRDRVGAGMSAERVVAPGCSRAEARRSVLGAVRWVTLREPATWRAEIEAVVTQIAALHEREVDPDLLTSGTPRPRAAIRTPSSSTDHLSRLVSEASYVLAHGEAELEVMAAEFGVSAERLVEDLQILFLCGDLGAGWEDLIDVEWEDGWVRVRNAAALDGPLRLSPSEATALLAGLGAVAAAGGEEAGVIESARAKLVEVLRGPDPRVPATADDLPAVPDPADPATGRGPAGPVAVDTAPLGRAERIVAHIQEALADDAAIVIRHSPPDRPGTSVRRVRPLRLESTAGRAYLRADDELSGAERHFRIDRIVELLDALPAAASEPSPTPVAAAGEARSTGMPEPAWIRLEPAAAWIAEAFSADEIRDLPRDGGILARIDDPVRSALLDAVMEAAGAAELLAPADLRDQIVTAARGAAGRHDAPKPIG